ncbi:Subtilisin-like protease SBT1.7 [Sesamum alatum]|uniref:Subtilisin-like protease SBT1.7 n=1 Tax=Sesamum alatum TaxID=300844 RepID=A0AAE1YRL2_9LAMI|nr:Subtilisin-like protease SBT1.7 [Sesamum alatum]
MEQGILVSCSAGNRGPSNFSLSNEAPWILTVGASTIDRKIRATAVLGDNQTFNGESTFQPMDFPPTLLPLVYAGMLNTSDTDLPFCTAESLNNTDIRGKIVVCEIGITRPIAKGRAVKDSGGAAMILLGPVRYANLTISDSHVLPATHVGYADGLKIKAYINSTSTPTATIVFKGTIIGDDRAPVVAAFPPEGLTGFLPANIFATGSGHVNPSRANDPGLVYDLLPEDYVPYLCGLNYTNRQVGSILQRRVNCSAESKIPETQLNYPSFALTFGFFQPTVQTYTRTVTNVGEPNSSYDVEIVPPPGIDVLVEPSKLDFLEVNQKLQYQVTFSLLNSTTNTTGFFQGYLKWNSSLRSVRSPIAVILR